MRITVETFGVKSFHRSLVGYERAARDLGPAFDNIHEFLLHQEELQFASEGVQGGTKWVPLSPRYAAWKRVHYPGMPILTRTGRLRASLTRAHDPDHIFTTSPGTLIFSSRVPYGKYHQFGTRFMPPRPPVRFNEAAKRYVVKILQRHLNEHGGRGI